MVVGGKMVGIGLLGASEHSGEDIVVEDEWGKRRDPGSGVTGRRRSSVEVGNVDEIVGTGSPWDMARFCLDHWYY